MEARAATWEARATAQAEVWATDHDAALAALAALRQTVEETAVPARDGHLRF